MGGTWYDWSTSTTIKNDQQGLLYVKRRSKIKGDWLVSGDDVPTATKQKTTYRQALRDVTSQSDPFN